MANKQNEDILAKIFIFLCIIVLIIIAIIYLAAIIAPAAILILFLVNLISYRSNDRHWRANGFWLTSSEKAHFKESCLDIVIARKSKEEVTTTLQEEGIAINQNGRISARSYKGKALRSQLESANQTLKESTKRYNELSLFPRKRWKSARKHYSMAVGWGCALIPWAAFFLAITLDIGGVNELMSSIASTEAVADSLQVNDHTIQKETLEAKQDTTSMDTSISEPTGFAKVISYGTVAIPVTIISLAVWLITWIIGIIVFLCKNPKPPIVDWDNFDRYTPKTKKNHSIKNGTRKTANAETSTNYPNNIEKKNSNIVEAWKHDGWLFDSCFDGDDGIVLSNKQGNPGKVGIYLEEGHYFLYAEYMEDKDFSEALKEKMGGEHTNGKWTNPISEPYYNRIIAGDFLKYFDKDKEFQDYVIQQINVLIRILERHHRTYGWKLKVGNIDGWKIFIWEWDILACQRLSNHEGTLYIDTSLDNSSGNITILMGNRLKNNRLLKNTLQRIGCPDKPIDNEGRAILDIFPITTAESIAEKIKYWIVKINE